MVRDKCCSSSMDKDLREGNAKGRCRMLVRSQNSGGPNIEIAIRLALSIQRLKSVSVVCSFQVYCPESGT